MKEEKLLKAFSQVDNQYLDIKDALAQERSSPMKKRKKLGKTLLIAAVVTVLLITVAYAAGSLINSPEQAWKYAARELHSMQELGILSSTITIPNEADQVIPLEETKGDEYWFGRIFHHRYAVSSLSDTGYINLDIDTASGKITRLTMEAYADENDKPTGTMEWDGKTWYLYRNYDDIFPADITVDQLCSRLAEYWGFAGYTLAGTQDDFYGYDSTVPDGNAKMMEIPEYVYLTVYFEGDQAGVPMYIEKGQYPGRVYFTIGTNHSVG